MKRHEFSWLADNLETCVTIGGPNPNGFWHVTHENVPGREDGKLIDDDTASAWSTVAYVMCEHGATSEETDAMVQAAPENLEWCFDGQVGMYAYDKNEGWDG